jgi:RecB family endonuclease NucS
MLLFKNKDSSLTSIERDSFKLEKDIQALVEANLDTLFGLELVTSEFTVGEFRLDSLAFDEQSNAFVIVEYKKGHSYSVVDQGYSYLSVMLNNKAEFSGFQSSGA